MSRHVKLIAAYAARFSVRGGGGVVFLLITLVFGLTVANLLTSPIEQAIAMGESQGMTITPADAERHVLRIVEPVMGFVLGANDAHKLKDRERRRAALDSIEEWTEHLLHKRPALLSAILLILSWSWPLLVVFGSFNLFAGDIQNRGLRYHLIRASRSSIFWGRVLGNLLIYVVVIAVVLGLVGAYLGLKFDLYDWWAIGRTIAIGAAALLLVTIPYVALCSWISAAIASPFAALTVVSLLVGFVPLAAFLAGLSYEPARNLKYLLPSGYGVWLFHPKPGVVLLAAAGCLGHATLFFWLGQRTFQRRDL